MSLEMVIEEIGLTALALIGGIAIIIMLSELLNYVTSF